MRKGIYLLLFCLACSIGTEKKDLIGSRIQGTWPSWSPDGKWLSYTRDENLWLIPVEGGKEKQATSREGREYQACWDQSDMDGRLVFANENDGLYRIMVLGISPYKLTTWYASTDELTWPCFSRDGEKIFFLEKEKHGIQVLNSVLGIPETVTNDAGWGQKTVCIQPSFIHDRILYVVLREDGSFNIESISTSGGTPETLIHREQNQNYINQICYATESPDGSKIVYYESIEPKIEWGYITNDIRLIIYDKINGINSTRKEVTIRVGKSYSYESSSYWATSINYSAAWSPEGVNLAYNWLYGIKTAGRDFEQFIMVDAL